jgi:ABC-type glycerol-3-phosphate transport system substrate-binding protein
VKDFPVFTYTTEFVEATGLELNLAATGQKDPAEALKDANAAFRKLLEKDGKL